MPADPTPDTVPSAQRALKVTRGLLPAQGPPRLADCVRGGAGALLGILVTGLVGRLALGTTADLPWIVAPMGASAVLVYAVPGSPLAQPWSVVGGNVSSALVGLAAAWAIGWPPLAAAVGVGGAIAVMIALRCLHPPGGACALTAALAPAAITGHGVTFAFWPVGLGSIVLVAVGIGFHTVLGRRYPHVAAAPLAAPTPEREADAAGRTGVDAAEVAAAMARLDQGLDIAPEDVVALVRDAEAHVLDRRLGGLRCGAVMRRDVVTVGPHDSLYRVRILINQHRVKALPVIDEERRVVGIIAIVDLFNLDAGDLTPVGQLMTTDVATVAVDTPVAALVGLMAEQGHRHVPVLDADDRLAGLVSRADLISVLHRLLIEGSGQGS
jgi:CBS domain-containing membrane protein